MKYDLEKTKRLLKVFEKIDISDGRPFMIGIVSGDKDLGIYPGMVCFTDYENEVSDTIKSNDYSSNYFKLKIDGFLAEIKKDLKSILELNNNENK